MACNAHAAGDAREHSLQRTVDEAVQPIRQQYGVPGIAVGVTVGGKHYFYNYGVASKDTRDPITPQTLFEVGSFSKTITATFACYAAERGALSLTDTASHAYPPLRGTSFDHVRLVNLGTHTSELPLFEPDSVTNDEQMMAFLHDWKPDHPVGTFRRYSNPGIGMLGYIAAHSMNVNFDDAVQNTLLPQLGMTHTYLQVPPAAMHEYAQGYTKDDKPIRLHPGALASEAYGIRTGTADIVRFLDVNMQVAHVDDPLQRAIACTHTGYFSTGPFVQDLIWEQYPYPVDLKTLQTGNGPDMLYKGTRATELTPPLPPQQDALLNKTGSTNGFSTYVAFVPARQIGVVILANKSYPIEARVNAVYRILTSLAGAQP
ncbi:class C beta-lactamase [Paraburkholderia phosphatilytica]|uniref:class C beta-lactamase n=1 Tax=Paraburkholderia phosphatilytica TaxID=2282883 RepID=UPI003B8368C1